MARGTVGREGPCGAAWIAELPAIVDGLLRRWDCEPDGPVLHGGVGVVVPVRRPDARPAVLKVSFPHPGNVHEPDAFTAWGGRGAVLLHARDDQRFAMLLERAGPSSLAEQADGDELVSVAGRLSRRLAVPAPPGLPRLREHAGRWEEELRAVARSARGGGQFVGCVAGRVPGAAGPPAAVGVGATGSLSPVCSSARRSRPCPVARTGMASRKVAAPR